MAKRSLIQTLFGIHPPGGQSRNAARQEARKRASAPKKSSVPTPPTTSKPSPVRKAVPEAESKAEETGLSTAVRVHRPQESAYWQGNDAGSAKAEAQTEGVVAERPDINRKAPEDQHFYIIEGPELTSLADLRDALDWISDGQFEQHAEGEQNDFANWARDVFGYSDLAERMRTALGRKSLKHILERV